MSKKNDKNQRSRLWKIIKGNKGFSLAEIMVALGITGIISLVVMSISKQSSKSSAKFKMDSDVVLTVNEINALLGDPEKCKLTFGGGVLDPDSIVSRVDTSTDPATVVSRKYAIVGAGGDDGYGNSKLRILDYELTGTGSEAVLNIRFENKKILKGKTGPSTLNKRINIYVEGSLSNIESCRSLSDSTVDIWSRGEGSVIFYSGGNVGIGMENPTVPLEIDGDVKSSTMMTAVSFLYSSDRRLKKDIHEISDPLEKVLALHGVNFTWRESDKRDMGFIAQEVQEQIPEIVNREESSDTLRVDYAKVVPLLVEAIKAQQKEIQLLKAQMEKLEEER